MRAWIYASVAAASLALSLGPATAWPNAGLSANPAMNDVQQAQFFYGDREYCWYDNGWHGPGFYWCGYALRRGYGWGGGYGWHGWHGGHRGGTVYRQGGGSHRSYSGKGGGTVYRQGGGSHRSYSGSGKSGGTVYRQGGGSHRGYSGSGGKGGGVSGHGLHHSGSKH
jgi:hypothetical protein